MIALKVLIATYNSAEHIANSLSSVVASSFSVPVQTTITVVDNNSWDGTAEIINRSFHDVRVIRNRENVGFGRAINQAARGSGHGDTDYYLILNPDVVLESGTLDCMLTFMETNPHSGVAGCRIVAPTGRPAISYYEFYTLGTEIVRLLSLSRLVPRSLLAGAGRFIPWGQARTYLANDRIADDVIRAAAVSGACLLLRRAVVGQEDIFDERFFLYYEDMDLCRRISLAGWDVVSIPKCSARHFAGASSGGSMAALCEKNRCRSMFLYHAKHHGKRRIVPLGSAYLLVNVLLLLVLSATPLGSRSEMVQRKRDVAVYAAIVSWLALRWCVLLRKSFTLPLVRQGPIPQSLPRQATQ